MLAGQVLADGPIVQTTPYTRTVLQAQNAAAAQTALGFTGASNAVTLTVISNASVQAMAPFSNSVTAFTNSMAYAIIASTNANYGQVDIRQFGAYVDGIAYNGCYCSNTTTLYDPLGRFSATDVGLYCWMRFGGTNGLQDWVTTIASYTSPNVLVLTAEPAMPTYNLPVVIGHDDSSAWQTAFNYYGGLNASVTYFVPVNPELGYGISMICTNINDLGDWRSHWNSQLHAPTMTLTASPAPIWTIEGACPQLGGTTTSYSPAWNPNGSTILCCTPFGNQGTNWYNNFNFSAETGGYIGNSGYAHFYGFNNLEVFFKNILIRGCYNDDVKMVNCAGATAAGGENSIFDGGFNQFATGSGTGSIPTPTFTNTACVVAAQGFSYPMSLWQRCQFNFGYYGIQVGDNTSFQNICCFGDPLAADYSMSDGGLSYWSGDNTFTGNQVIFSTPSAGTYLDASGLDIQEINAGTNWCLANDPFNNFYARISFDNTASPMLSTNQGNIIGGNYIDVERISNGQRNTHWLHDGNFYVGGAYPQGGFPQENAQKQYWFLGYNWSSGAEDIPGVLLGLNDIAQNVEVEYIGGGNSGAYHGPEDIQFWTAANDTSASIQRAEIDSSGNLEWDAPNAILEGFQNGIFSGQITATNFDLTPGPGVQAIAVSATGNSGTIDAFNILGPGSYWEEQLNSLNWPNLSVAQETTAKAWTAYSVGLTQMATTAITTNGAVLASGGFGSTATNSIPFGATGITNTLPVNLEVFGIAGSSIWVTNAATGYHAFINQGSSWGSTVILQPGAAVTGTGLSSGGNIAL